MPSCRIKKSLSSFICKTVATIELVYAFTHAFASYLFTTGQISPGGPSNLVPLLCSATGAILLLGVVRKRSGYVMAWLVMKALWVVVALGMCGVLGAIMLAEAARNKSFGKTVEGIDEERMVVLACQSLIFVVLLPFVHTYYLHLKPKKTGQESFSRGGMFMEMTPREAEGILNKNYYC